MGGNCGSGPHQLWDPVQVTALSPRLLPSCVMVAAIASSSNNFPQVYSFRHLWTGHLLCARHLLGAVWMSEGDTQAHDSNLLRTLRSTEGT